MRASFRSKNSVERGGVAPATAPALRAIAVLIPPGCTQVTSHRMAGDQHLLAQRLGEPAHRELGRVVGALAGHRQQAEQAGDVDDVPVAGAIRCGRNAFVPLTTPQKSTSMTRSICSKLISSMSPVNAMPALLITMLTTPKSATTASAYASTAAPVGDIESVVRAPCAPMTPRLPGRLGEPDVVDVGERELGAAAGEVVGERASDAGAGAGDHGDLAAVDAVMPSSVIVERPVGAVPSS